MSGAPLHRRREPFPAGLTWITRAGEGRGDSGLDFGILRLAPGERERLAPGLERAVLLIAGEVRFATPAGELAAWRGTPLDDEPFAVHVAAHDEVTLAAGAAGAELAIVRTANSRGFAPLHVTPESLLEREHRGRGALDDTAYRIVRTLVDDRNRPAANLVLGEVVNFQGRWSSYPPHHHPQPEIYHYRFSAPQGYGHAELGEEVVKVRSFDTLEIRAGADHPQVAAPGYAMWYLWVIRHLAEARYATPEFAADHRWVLDAGRGGEP